MTRPVRRLIKPGQKETEEYLNQEWLLTNGLGGYASGTIAGVPTRRFHGYLISALPAPLGRVSYFNHLVEKVILPDGKSILLGGEETKPDSAVVFGAEYLTEFRLDMGLPVWIYEFHHFRLEKKVVLPHLQNSVYITWRLLDGNGVIKLELRPAFNFRPHEGLLNDTSSAPYSLTIIENQYEISSSIDLPKLRMLLYGTEPKLILDQGITKDHYYRIEDRRGYDAQGVFWSPGYFSTNLSHGEETTLVASTESWNVVHAFHPQDAFPLEYERRQRLIGAAHTSTKTGMGAELVLAADQFIISPAGRSEEAARVRAAGDETRTIIAGYPWFTDWGRDTMISFEGLTLVTGRFVEAGWILRTFAHYVKQGLIPNMFPEGKNDGLYNTADATFWFFHALDRYVDVTGDRQTLRLILPKLMEIITHHLRGTRFNIHVDREDGLLIQGEQGYQLTWMDAKVGDWVVTPRRGKAVEINALWYNALRLLEGWLREEGNPEDAQQIAVHADRAHKSFNNRFWYEDGKYLYDVVDGENGDDSACRPNQIISISLRYPVLNSDYWNPVLDAVAERLLTSVGLRTLDPNHPEYRSKYSGDLRSRDAAYHQGTVWPWLIGPFIDAWLKVHPDDRRSARRFLDGFNVHLNEACVGTISEIFDAEPPFNSRGCVSQAWSVAEVLRCWCLTA